MDMVGVTDGHDYANHLLLEEKNFVTVKKLFTEKITDGFQRN